MTNNQDRSDPGSHGDLPPGPTGNRTHDREGDCDRQRTERSDAAPLHDREEKQAHAMPMSGEIRSPPPPAVATPFRLGADGSPATWPATAATQTACASGRPATSSATPTGTAPSARRSRRRAHPPVSPQCDTCSRHPDCPSPGSSDRRRPQGGDELRGREGADEVAGDDAESQKHGPIVRCRPAGVPVSSETCRPTTTDATIVARRLRSGSRSPRTP